MTTIKPASEIQIGDYFMDRFRDLFHRKDARDDLNEKTLRLGDRRPPFSPEEIQHALDNVYRGLGYIDYFIAKEFIGKEEYDSLVSRAYIVKDYGYYR